MQHYSNKYIFLYTAAVCVVCSLISPTCTFTEEWTCTDGCCIP